MYIFLYNLLFKEMVCVLQTFFALRSLTVSSCSPKFRRLNERIRKERLYFGVLMVPMEALSKAIQLVPHWLCWGLWKSFMFKQAPTELLEGLRLSWDMQCLTKSDCPQFRVSALGKRLPGASC